MEKEFRLKILNETENYLLQEIKDNELVIKKHKNDWIVLNYVEHLHILVSTITGCISISAFVSLVFISVEITSSALGMKTCAIIAGIKKYK